MEGPQNPKSTEKILTCKENKNNEDLQDSSKSVLSPKPKLSVMFYTEPLRNRNSQMPMLLTHSEFSRSFPTHELRTWMLNTVGYKNWTWSSLPSL